MSKTLTEGTDPKTLDTAFMEYFSPGQRAEVLLELPRILIEDEVVIVGDYLVDNGLDVHSIGMRRDNRLRLVVTRPPRPKGAAVAPMTVVLIAALGVLGIAGFVSWEIANAISENILPLMLIGGTLIGLYIYSEKYR